MGLIHPHLTIDLPLPLSKNATKFGKFKRNKPEVWDYRGKIYAIVNLALKNKRLVFKDRVWTFVSCWWRKPAYRYDHINFHDELADALQVPLSVNDRYFLLRDMSVEVDKRNPGVMVDILQP